MYTYEIEENPPMTRILKEGVIIDYSGPWESVESATTWATMYVNSLNNGTIQPEEPT